MTTASVMTNNLLEGFHSHHINPKHLGGSNDASNLVMLHPYDHAIAHYVRWKMFNTSGDAWAFNKLKKWLDDGAFTVKGMKHTDESRKKISIASTSRKRNFHSSETKEKISIAKTGQESNRKGKKHSEESIKKMRESHLGQQAWNKGTVGIMKAWNSGLVGKQEAWNKNKSGVVKWNDDAKKLQSERIKAIWAKRKQEAICQ